MRNVLKTPNQAQVDCQHPKPILLDTGEMKEPYDWAVRLALTFFFFHAHDRVIKYELSDLIYSVDSA